MKKGKEVKQTETGLLKFSPGNAKIPHYSLNLLSGYSCPFAEKCLAKVDLVTGKLITGPKAEFRCFSATQENIFKATRAQREYNFNTLRKLKTVDEMADLINRSLPAYDKSPIIRIHVAGDFFSQTYFDAWLQVARNNPERLFYAYTKSLPYWLKRDTEIPVNLRMTASEGGKRDDLIIEHGLKYAKVVEHQSVAEELNLPIDHTDSLAYASGESFALVIHGTQPAGSKWSKGKSKMAEEGWTGYHRTNSKGEKVGYGNGFKNKKEAAAKKKAA